MAPAISATTAATAWAARNLSCQKSAPRAAAPEGLLSLVEPPQSLPFMAKPTAVTHAPFMLKSTEDTGLWQPKLMLLK